MTIPVEQLRLYAELAEWWPLFTSPEEYKDEVAYYAKVIKDELKGEVKTVLELGSGGGNSASHLKKHFQMTLVDLSENMLNVSRKLNPECEHVLGVNKVFDAVYVHDAIAYMHTEKDLRKTIETAYLHCRPGGMTMMVPDYIKENFTDAIVTGGHDKLKQGLRYMEWIWDPDPSDTSYLSDMVYMVRDENGQMNCVYDRHILGLFSQETWIRIMKEVGFIPKVIPFDTKSDTEGVLILFVGHKPLK